MRFSVEETIEHVVVGCLVLAGSAFIDHHNKVVKIVHQQFSLKHNLINRFVPYYEYSVGFRGVFKGTHGVAGGNWWPQERFKRSYICATHCIMTYLSSVCSVFRRFIFTQYLLLTRS